MSWDGRIQALAPPGKPLEAIETLFDEQTESWPLLAAGLAGLRRAESREIVVGPARLAAWHIPHRITSATSRVDPASVSARSCFLCPDNLPPEERGVALGTEFVITCNPFPILGRHVSVVGRAHRPQKIAGDADAFRAMLDLAAALPGYLVLYNGPECGASAPDHIHFQACLHAGVPVMDWLGRTEGGVLEGYPAPALVLRGRDEADLIARLDGVFSSLEHVAPGREEPMVNIVTICERGEWTVLIFPRASHRPRVYTSGELVWSPGALDLAGILVLPRESDLDRVSGSAIREGFAEVCIPADRLRDLAAGLEAR